MDMNFNLPSLSCEHRVLTKHSSDEYQYKIFRVERGVTIVLVQQSSQKQKHFFLAGSWQHVDGLFKHMDSLTDDLCGQWFNERVPKKKEKK